MLNLIRKPLQIFRLYKQTFQQPISKALKKIIFKTAIKVNILKPKNRGEGSINIGNLKVKYCHFGNLEYVFNEVFLRSEYLVKIEKDEPVIIDAGANIGLTTLYFKLLWPKSSIIAFEPDEKAFDCLDQNIKGNKLEDVFVKQSALAKEKGQLTFYSDADSDGSLTNSSSQVGGTNKTQVEAVKLSEYITQPVDLLKMDIEGGEFDVMDDLIGSGKISFVNQIYMEYHHNLPGQAGKLGGMLSDLESNGFDYQIRGDFDKPPAASNSQNLVIFAKKINH